MEPDKRSYRFDEAFFRADAALLSRIPELSRNQLKRRLSSLLINGEPARLSHPVKEGDTLLCTLQAPSVTTLEAAPISFSVLFEDEEVIVVDKPQGLVVHPGPGHHRDTLVNGLLWHRKDVFDRGDWKSLRPGIVHRLDADTSGVMIIAKSLKTQAFLASQFAERRVDKRYLALVKGRLRTPEATLRRNIRRDRVQRYKFSAVEHGGKEAETAYRVIDENDAYSFIEFIPRSGRTHQIRVHAQYLGHPILGDPLYARVDANYPALSMQLHAYSLAISLKEGCNTTRFCAALPPHMNEALSLTRLSGGDYA